MLLDSSFTTASAIGLSLAPQSPVEGLFVDALPWLAGVCPRCQATPTACPQGKIQGFTGDGYFAEYAVVDSRCTLKLPDGISSLQHLSPVSKKYGIIG